MKHRRKEGNTNEELCWDGMAAGGDLSTTGELQVSKPRKCCGSKVWDLKAILSGENLMESSSPQSAPQLRSVLGPPQTEHKPLWTPIVLGGYVQTNTWCDHWYPWDLPSEGNGPSGGSEPPPPELTGFLRKKRKTFCPLQQQITHKRVRKNTATTHWELTVRWPNVYICVTYLWLVRCSADIMGIYR